MKSAILGKHTGLGVRIPVSESQLHPKDSYKWRSGMPTQAEASSAQCPMCGPYSHIPSSMLLLSPHFTGEELTF